MLPHLTTEQRQARCGCGRTIAWPVVGLGAERRYDGPRCVRCMQYLDACPCAPARGPEPDCDDLDFAEIADTADDPGCE